MTLTPLLTTKLELGAVAALIVVGGIALHEHDAHIKEQAVAQAVVDTAKKDQQVYAQQVSDLAKQMDARDAAYQTQLQLLDKRFQAANSPQQVAALVSQLLALPKPITVVTPQPTAENPHPTPVAQIPEVDFPSAKAYVQQCEDCKAQTAKLTADAADRQAQANLAQLQIDSLKKENTALAVEAKGGSTWTRTKRALKYIGLGVGIGAAALCASSHCR